jgi:hypothetical protein
MLYIGKLKKHTSLHLVLDLCSVVSLNYWHCTVGTVITATLAVTDASRTVHNLLTLTLQGLA